MNLNGGMLDINVELKVFFIQADLLSGEICRVYHSG